MKPVITLLALLALAGSASAQTPSVSLRHLDVGSSGVPQELKQYDTLGQGGSPAPSLRSHDTLGGNARAGSAGGQPAPSSGGSSSRLPDTLR